MLNTRYISLREDGTLARDTPENGRWFPGGGVDLGREIGRQDASDILREASAGDVGEPACTNADELLDLGQVRAMRGEQRFADRHVQLRIEVAPRCRRQRASGEAVAVGVQTGRGESEQNVTRGRRAVRADRGAVHHTDDEPGQIELTRRVDIRHLGRLPAQQRATGRGARVRDTRDDGGDHLRIGAVQGQVIEEKERSRPLDRDIVDAVIDDVRPERVVATERRGDLHLGANAIGRGDQHRIGEFAGRAEAEHAAEGSHVGQHTGPARPRDDLL